MCYKHISNGCAGKTPKSLSYVTHFLLPDRRGTLQQLLKPETLHWHSLLVEQDPTQPSISAPFRLTGVTLQSPAHERHQTTVEMLFKD